MLFAASVAALAGAALRVASLAAPDGAARLLAAVALAGAAGVIETLSLGLAGLGGEPLALGGAAIATWILGRVVFPAPRLRPSVELATWLRGLDRVGWIGLLGGIGATVALLVLGYRAPILGGDSVQFHLPQVITWIGDGHPGSVEVVNALFPLGSYPLTNQVLLTWGMGMSRSFAPVQLWGVAVMWILVIGGLSGLRALGVARGTAVLAVTALVTTPIAFSQTIGATTDLPAVAWLVCAASLAAATGGRPALLAPAIVAAALAVGTKTTVVFLAAVILAVPVAASRGRLRAMRTPLLLAVAAALGAGGVWYLRNLIRHGSPLWPFFRGPVGDPAPGFLDRVGTTSFADRPAATLDGHLRAYADAIAGSVVVLAAALAAPLAARRRAIVWSAAATLTALLLWTVAPFTGIPAHVPPEWVPALAGQAVNASRYLLPAIAAGCLTLALAARSNGRARLLAHGALAAAIAWNLIRLAGLEDFKASSPPLVACGFAAGSLAGILLPSAAVAKVAASRVAQIAVVLALGLATSAAAHGYVGRHAAVDLHFLPSYGPLLRSLVDRSDFSHDGRAVAIAPLTLAPLAGDRLEHPIELIPARESCASVERLARTRWVVVYEGYYFHPYTARRCFRQQTPVEHVGPFSVYRPG